MINALTFSLGGRYALSRRSSLSFITGVAVSGLALSVAVLIVVVSVINGFERELEDRVLSVLPHLSFYGRDPLPAEPAELEALAALPGVAGSAAFVQGAGLAGVADQVVGVSIAGIDPAGYGAVSRVLDFARTQEALRPGEFGVLLGSGVADRLAVSVGDAVTLVLPAAAVTPAGLIPRQKRFRVRGILRTQSEVDSRAAYIHLSDAQRLFRLGELVHGYQLRLEDLFDVAAVAAAGRERLGAERVRVTSWMRTHGNLYRAIGVQKTTMFVLLSFLIAVAAFNLVSTLVMVVDQRSSDIAILRSLGANTGTLVGAFVLLGLVLGGLGVVIGMGAGVALASALPPLYGWLSDVLSLDLMTQYFVSYLPVEVRLSDLVGIVATALALCVLSTLYPALRAAALRPAEVLAHE